MYQIFIYSLVSAFENKILYAQDPRYMNLAEAMERNFTKFIDRIIRDFEQCERFNYEKHKCQIDRHWRPYYLRCDYCNVGFDVIGKVETFEDDAKFILQEVGVSHLLLPHDERGNQIMLISSKISLFSAGKVVKQLNSNKHDSDRTRAYLEELSPSTRQKLIKFYRLDFDLFGYKPFN